MTNQLIWDLARRAARDVAREVPEACRTRRVQVGAVARALEVKVHTRDDLPAQRARWYRHRLREPGAALQLWDDSPAVDVVEVRSDLRTSARRFAVAHELGHVVLHRRFDSAERQLEQEDQERFASAFAAELLIPFAFRHEIRDQFRAAADPVALLRLSDELGVSPQTVLRFAGRENWLGGLDRVWLDVRCRPNRYTQRNKRLRVFDAVLDKARWFLPRNRSVAGVMGSDEPLLDLYSGLKEADIRLDISRRSTEPPVRFVRESVRARLATVRLSRGEGGSGMELLAAVHLQV
ncbi:MAG TPA: ImmA/IrrE family metallo-endopeptidase [Solirubrobacteraceae bacterium]